jgi:hypothetical protein
MKKTYRNLARAEIKLIKINVSQMILRIGTSQVITLN